MASKLEVPHDVILANQKALDHCKVLQESHSFTWFIGLLAARREETINSLALNQADKLAPNDCAALRGKLGLLLELADKDGNCPLLDEISASAKLLQAPE